VNSEPDQLIGLVIDGRYKIESKIARGGMATVYRAYDHKLSRVVAIKIMHKYLSEGEEGQDFLERFDREARSAAMLNHKVMVGIYDQGNFQGQRYLVMEYIDGITLRDLLKREGVLSVRDTFNTVIALLQGLETAHAQGLVHRDIKPENVLIDRKGGVHLTDFGLSKAITELKTTATGTILGTVAYVAPEIVDYGTVSPKADIYSIGIMMYELLTAKPPFQGKSAIQTAFMHVKKNVPDLTQEFPNIHPFVGKLIQTFCEKDETLRPQNAQEALRLISKVKANLTADELDQKTTSVPGDAATQILKDVPVLELQINDPALTAEHEAISLDSSSDSDSGSDLNSGSINSGTDDADGSKSAPKKPSRARRWIITLILLAIVGGGGTLWWIFFGPGAYQSLPASMIGQIQLEAENYLKDHQIAYHISEDWSLSIPKGSVAETVPAPATPFKFRDTTATIIISKGIHYVTFPDGVTGATLEKAEEVLVKAGFVVEVAKVYSLEVASGTVINTSRQANSQAIYGETITLTVSQGPEPVKMIAVVGQSEADARAALEKLKLKIELKSDFSSSVKAGLIMSQTPASGQQLKQGDTVTIVTSLGPAVEVPDLFGKSVAAAHEQLTSLGLTWVDQIIGSGQLGLVQSQNPAAGERVVQGSTVTLGIV
jgi:serine/threonine-protein kinase